MLYINRGQEKLLWFCLNTKTKCKTDTKKKHTSQTLKGAVIFDDDLPLKTALNDRTRSQFFKFLNKKQHPCRHWYVESHAPY